MTKHQDTIYFEMVQVGKHKKCIAIDSFTGQEACVIGNHSYSFDMLKYMARNKLKRLINNSRGEKKKEL